MRNKVLVTGADGFIGSHLTELLVRRGYDVRAFVQYNSFGQWGWLDNVTPEIIDNFEVVAGDIRDTGFVEKAAEGVDAILHLAALIAIPYSYSSPASYIETNINGTLNILRAAERCNTQHIVCTSTSEIYGTAQFVPITEDHPQNAQSPYAASKIGADQLALSFQKSFDLPVSILRPFNTYGPRQSARAVIPTIISQIASGQTTIKLGDLTPTRDFTFVEDTAEGFIQAMNCDTCIGSVTNIGSGFEVSIGQTVELIGNVMGANVEIVQDLHRMRPENSEVERLWAGTELAKERFDWNPVHGGLEGFKKGLKKTADWFCKPENLKSYKSTRYNQ